MLLLAYVKAYIPITEDVTLQKEELFNDGHGIYNSNNDNNKFEDILILLSFK